MSDQPATLSSVQSLLRAADLLVEARGAEDVSVQGVAQDSRRVRAGDIFLAWKGTAVDAHDHVQEAGERGAVAAVVERPVDAGLPQLVVSDGRRAAALAAHLVVGSPSRELLAIGVTGTNGKTTTASLIRHLLDPHVPTAVIGTLGLIDRDGVRPGTEGLTTPGPVQVALWLRDLVDVGMGAVVIEASSHALEQARLDGVDFDVAVFTNLTQDHLDYHADMEGYGAAKAHLVELVEPGGTVVVNGAEPAWERLEVGSRRVRRFAVEADADVSAWNIDLGAFETRFVVRVDDEARDVRTPLVGRYNVENVLAAVTVARQTGVPLDDVTERLGTVPQVTGRLEAVIREPFTVLIDFAHTPGALRSALAAVKPLTGGRLIVAFGAGGDRDRAKRRPMAEAVAEFADLVVLTSDNPRSEDPEAILDDLEAGLEGVAYVRHVNRADAVRAALEWAEPGDTVVLAGKGHETYQVVGTEKQPFDERRIVRDVLAELGVS